MKIEGLTLSRPSAKSYPEVDPDCLADLPWGFPIMRFLVPPPPTHPPLQKMTKLKMTRYQIFPLEFHLYSSARIV